MDFIINPQQRTVTSTESSVTLSKKSFDILFVLLQHHGNVATKEQLMAEVWPNQFITDSALNKQIERLRKSLNPSGSEETIIETIRGVGFRLICEVQESSTVTDTSKTNKFYLPVGIAIFIFALAFFAYNWYQQKTATPLQTNEEKQVVEKSNKYEPINIAIIPAEKTDDWLNVGGLNYLSELLQQHSIVETINPQKEWFNNSDGNIFATQILKADNINYALVLKNIVFEDKFKSQIELRSRKGILITTNLQAESLSLLFENINTWVYQQIKVGSGLNIKSNKLKNISDYALENYLRGLTAGNNGKYKQATEFLEIAINEDQSFDLAWLMLAKLEAELGNYEKSAAVLETIQQLDTFDKSLLNHLYNAKAKSLLYLNKLDEADALLNKSIALSDENHDMKAKITSLANQVMVHDRRGKINEKTLDILIQQLDLVKKFNPSPTQIARLNYNLSIINTVLNNPQDSRDYIEKAIHQYKQLNYNTVGLFASYAVLSYQYYELAQNDKALMILADAEKIIDKVESPSVVGNFYMNKARNQGEQGLRTQSLDTLKKLDLLSAKTGAKQHKVLGYLVLIEQQIAYNDVESAKESIQEFIAYVSDPHEDYLANVGYIATFDMYITARYDSPDLARKKMKNYLEAHPDMENYLSEELKRTEAHIFANEGFVDKAASELDSLMNNYLKKGRIMEALHVGYEVLEIQWNNNMQGYKQTLSKLQEYTTFEYPIVKFEAMLFAYNKDYISAANLMQELKPKAREFWSIEDQLLLEEYQQKAIE